MAPTFVTAAPAYRAALQTAAPAELGSRALGVLGAVGALTFGWSKHAEHVGVDRLAAMHYGVPSSAVTPAQRHRVRRALGALAAADVSTLELGGKGSVAVGIRPRSAPASGVRSPRMKHKFVTTAYRNAYAQTTRHRAELGSRDLGLFGLIVELTATMGRLQTTTTTRYLAARHYHVAELEVAAWQRHRMHESLRKLHRLGVITYAAGRGREAAVTVGLPAPASVGNDDDPSPPCPPERHPPPKSTYPPPETKWRPVIYPSSRTYKGDTADPSCGQCEGTGWTWSDTGGHGTAAPCPCRVRGSGPPAGTAPPVDRVTGAAERGGGTRDAPPSHPAVRSPRSAQSPTRAAVVETLGYPPWLEHRTGRPVADGTAAARRSPTRALPNAVAARTDGVGSWRLELAARVVTATVRTVTVGRGGRRT